MQQVASRSDFIPRSMFDADDTYAQAISRSLKTDCRDYEAIDRVFRADTPLAIVNEAHPIRNQLALARTVPRQAVQKMRLSVGETSVINNVIFAD